MILQGLRKLRTAKQLTQKRLAEMAGTTRVTVFRVENGQSTTWATAQKLADALDTTVEDLEVGEYVIVQALRGSIKARLLKKIDELTEEEMWMAYDYVTSITDHETDEKIAKI